ncbi:NAD(P)H-binding protein [Hyalangium versicolor]|uniref:NAD(P)H-binding protein n=1 Tax=Hyalangium versicolor TaxID=2861190 RepID=UPI001CCDCBCF|nr:NAD(P)H-binding protein [Hyalangium versicolor]
MSKVLVTGASGHIGRLTLEKLLDRRPASELLGLVRDPAKARELAARGIELRQGDYLDKASLLRAFEGVDRLMLTSTHAFTDRKTAHANAIDAAAEAGIGHIVYMPIIRKEGSDFSMRQVTEEDIFSEQRIVSSGLTYTFVKHPPFLDTMTPFLGVAMLEKGVRVPAGDGKTGPATRADLAEAHAAVLTGSGHENKSYVLTGSPAVSFSDIAAILSQMTGETVPYVAVSDQDYVDARIAEGLPEFVARFLLGWVQGMNRGEWDQQTGDLEALLGRAPTTTEQYLRQALSAMRRSRHALAP